MLGGSVPCYLPQPHAVGSCGLSALGQLCAELCLASAMPRAPAGLCLAAGAASWMCH